MGKQKGLVPLLVLSLALFGFVAEPQGAPPLLKPTSKEGLVEPEPDPAVVRQSRVEIDLSALRAFRNNRLQNKIRLPLFDRAEVTLALEKQESPRENTVISYGAVEGQPGSTVILSNVDDAVAADIMTRDSHGRFAFYQIRYLGNGVHVLSEIDPSRFPPEAPPNAPSVPPSSAPAGWCGDPASIIDVLVVYTGRARVAAGNTTPGVTNSGIEAEIYQAVAAANLAYANSDVAQRLRLVHMEEVTFSENSKTPTEILAALQNGSGGLSDVPARRETYSADVVVLIVASLDACGKANVMEEDVSQAFASQAYCIVRRNCSVTNLSFPHELGHLMGAEHEWGIDETPTVPASVQYKHGFIQRTPTPSVPPWHTVMAIDENCLEATSVNCGPRIPYFSNPNVFYPPGSADPTGVGGAEPADNHRRLNDTALVVANFRCAAAGANNVWMKDADDDTGREPDPQTAGEPMWKSPAIWVRNTQDTAGAHRHDHENPRTGGPNWIYVEMQNGGGQTFGELEVYSANASTSLLWPAGWTLISKTRVDFAPVSAQIVEVPWTPPQAGHFCLLSRWVSPADPMTLAETGNVEANVRGNNNLAWRNLNVIDLSANPAADASFEISPAGGGAFSIVVRAARTPDGALPAIPFRLAVELDDRLVRAWRHGGARAENARVDGRRATVDLSREAVLANLRLEHGAMGRVKLIFERSGQARGPDIIVDVVQVENSDPGRAARPIGGVSYVVRTQRSSGPDS